MTPKRKALHPVLPRYRIRRKIDYSSTADAVLRDGTPATAELGVRYVRHCSSSTTGRHNRSLGFVEGSRLRAVVSVALHSRGKIQSYPGFRLHGTTPHEQRMRAQYSEDSEVDVVLILSVRG